MLLIGGNCPLLFFVFILIAFKMLQSLKEKVFSEILESLVQYIDNCRSSQTTGSEIPSATLLTGEFFHSVRNHIVDNHKVLSYSHTEKTLKNL